MTISSLLGHSYGVPESRSDLLTELLEESRSLGFLGPMPIEQHVAHAMLMLKMISESVVAERTSVDGDGSDTDLHRQRLLDLGSGGGVPGLIIAVALPHLQVVALDSMAKRCDFLSLAAERLGGSMLVEHGRAEVLAQREDLRGTFDLVVARSFGSPAVTSECAAGFLRSAGRLLISEPPIELSDRWPTGPLGQLGLRVMNRVGDGTSSIVELTSESDPRDGVPRRDGMPSKRPLW